MSARSLRFGLYSPGLAREKGVALVMALIVLTLIMLVGVASLRQSAVQARIAANTNAAGLGFQAADSAVEQVMADIVGGGSVLNELVSAPSVKRCIGEVLSAEDHTCHPLEGGATVHAFSETRPAERAQRAVTGSSTDTVVWRFYQVEGTGTVGDNAFVSVTHEQEFARREVAAGDDIFEDQGEVAQQ